MSSHITKKIRITGRGSTIFIFYTGKNNALNRTARLGYNNAMRRLLLASLFVFFLLLSACSTFTTDLKGNTPIPISDLLTGEGGRFTATPTPFQPAFKGINSPSVFASTPSVTPPPDTGGMIALGLARPASQVNILLLGSDWRPGQGYRTDVIMILSLIPDSNRVTLLSFPRDLYVNIPGIGYERLNSAQAYGGFPLTAETLKTSFDASVDYYMMTDFSGFKNIIDTLGGIQVYATSDLYDRCDLPQAYAKMCYIPAGWNTMNGETALWYARSRYSTSDFDRTRRAQEVAVAITQKMISLNALNRAGELYQLFLSSVETDIPLDLIARLLPMAATAADNPSSIHRFTITEDQTTNYIVPATGAMVLLPDYDSIARTIQDALYPSLEH